MVRRFHYRRRALLMGGAAALAAPALRAASPVTVFAAASLKGPLDEILPEARLVYGGSGALARQVAQGAPADLVILAAADWMAWLETQGATAAPQIIARNALVLAGPSGGAPLDLTADAVMGRLASGRLAMGDPVSVPAGRYAQQAFETLGLWAAVASRAIFAENVRAALSYVARGDVPLAAVYRSDARLPGLAELAGFPATSHAPILYPAAVTRRADPAAQAVLARVMAAGEVFARHGFAPA